MTKANAAIAFLSALAGGLAVALFAHPVGQIAASKTARLGGSSTETAFMPQRFGVPGAEMPADR
ncbi:MAG: hypothetical protein PW791_10400 [Neorhizobium sp.]|nr:hypothetical protein [Neorhizobium sp.]